EREDEHRRERGEDVDRRSLVEAERSGSPDRDVADRRYVDREQKGVHWSPEGRAGFNPGAASVRLTYFISQTSNPRWVTTIVIPSTGRLIPGWWRNNTSATRITARRSTYPPSAAAPIAVGPLF